MLSKECLLVHRTELDIVDPLHIRKVAAHPGIEEGTVLRDALGLDWPEIGKRIIARVVVVKIFAEVSPEIEDRVG